MMLPAEPNESPSKSGIAASSANKSVNIDSGNVVRPVAENVSE